MKKFRKVLRKLHKAVLLGLFGASIASIAFAVLTIDNDLNRSLILTICAEAYILIFITVNAPTINIKNKDTDNEIDKAA